MSFQQNDNIMPSGKISIQNYLTKYQPWKCHNDKMMLDPKHLMPTWQNVQLTEWQHNKMAFEQNDTA